MTPRKNRPAARRLEVLHNEVDVLLAESFNRQESISHKASFLAVSSGIILTGLTAQLWVTPKVFLLISITFTILGLALAATALAPVKRTTLDGQRLVDTFIDSTFSRFNMEQKILISKTNSLTARNIQINRHALLVNLGFWALVFASISFGAGYTLHYL